MFDCFFSLLYNLRKWSYNVIKGFFLVGLTEYFIRTVISMHFGLLLFTFYLNFVCLFIDFSCFAKGHPQAHAFWLPHMSH